VLRPRGLAAQLPAWRLVLREFALAQRERLRLGLAAWWRDNRLTFDWKAAVGALFGGLLFIPLVYRLPLIGYDLQQCFRQTANPCGQVPWVDLAASFLLRWDWRIELAILNSLMGMAVIMAVAREAKDRRGRLLAVALAILTPQIFVLAWTGQIDGLGLLGLLAMPWGCRCY
jgi:hypothetical protein